MKTFSIYFAKVAVLSFFMVMLATVIVPSIGDAAAQSVTGTTVSADANQNTFVSVMCNVLKIVTGNGGKAFAAFAIISVGIGFFTGKVSWGLMIGVAMGIAAMFGAPTIVAAITGRNTFDCGS